MCGIAGIFDSSSRTQGRRDINPKILEAMNQVQIHRGPDDGGYFIQKGIGLAHRRLSIIDISTGQQPLFSQDKSVVIVFNGEIYNYRDIRETLVQKGYKFQTHSDTEVIVCAWQEWGEQCVNKLRGMFAFAIWDIKKQSLFIARDRMGIKPLYYTWLASGQFIFGSELKVLMAHPDFKKELDFYATEEYFALGYVPEPRTIYKNVFKLPPGYSLSIQPGMSSEKLTQYWDIPFKKLPEMDEKEISSELIRRFKEAVDIRMVSEVPLGAFLSGGVDSSAVVAMMAGLQNEPVNTCAIGFDVKTFDESKYAAQVAEQFQTNHHLDTVDTEDFSLIDKLATLYDEPYADSSAMPTYRVCQLARKRVTVALSGDGGDETFAGYRRYRWHMNEERLRSLFPQSIRPGLFGFLGAVYPKADWAPKIFRAKTTFQALARDPVEGYFHNFSILTDQLRNSIYSPKLQSELQGYNAIEVFRKHAENSPTDDPLSLVQYIDMKTYLVGDILTKVDRASMAHSLEVRVPILDHEFIEWSSGLPWNIKLKGQEGKHIFKKALKPYLSKDILYRKKMGFAVPLEKWFRGPLKERVKKALEGELMSDCGLFNRQTIHSMVDQHQSGMRDHSAAIWSLLMYEAFLRQVHN
ncbi:MAG: amidotransferase 1, exosortase A system-associated [Gammaproteobacteria bacterium]|nr:amidotransferase 1, exosortase A system-associated [Gammaproteobacteria bacterium]